MTNPLTGKASYLAEKLLPALRFTMPAGSGVIYLTFDDGPHPESTPRLLELLAKHEAKATFFCLGQNVEKHPSLYDQIIAAGHSTGNHTWSHPNGWITSTPSYMEDVDRAARVIDSKLFRPPYGRITPGQYRQLRKRYNIIMWTRMFADYRASFNPSKINLSGLRPGDIPVMHDTPRTIDKTLELTQNILSMNYRYAAIPAL